MKLGKAGDTIVEVMLAMTVVSLVLTGAFVSSSKAFHGGRLSQERGEALKLAEAQIENLKALAATGTVDIFDASLLVSCTHTEASKPARKDIGSLTVMPALDADDFGAYPNECRDNLYHMSLEYQSSTNLFFARSRWEGPTNGRQEVLLTYRVHPKPTIAAAAVSPFPPPPPPPGPVAAVCTTTPSPITIAEVPGGPGGLTVSHLYRPGNLTYTVDISAATAGMSNNCNLNVRVTTRDPGHADPGMAEQEEERLFVRFILRDGGEVATELTDDLPEGTTTITTDVGNFSFPSPPIRAIFTHYSVRVPTDPRPNSIDPASVLFTPIP